MTISDMGLEYPPRRIPGFDWIYGTLYQGSVPPPGLKGFDVIVLCAEEFQPSPSSYPDVEVLYAPNDDADLTGAQACTAVVAAHRVARRLAVGKRVLVTCMQGRNRSGLVSALALMHHSGMSAEDAVTRVRLRRKTALQNPAFVKFLHHYEKRAP